MNGLNRLETAEEKGSELEDRRKSTKVKTGIKLSSGICIKCSHRANSSLFSLGFTFLSGQAL